VAALENKPGLKIKPGCEAKILWANDSTRQSTEYVLLYLHGFSASRREGYPVNEDFAKHFGCNAFLARLASHGEISDNPLIDMTPEPHKRMVAFEKAGNHVIACDLTSGAVPDVRSQTFAFAKEVLGMKSNR
jgi:hypothetical protein